MLRFIWRAWLHRGCCGEAAKKVAEMKGATDDLFSLAISVAYQKACASGKCRAVETNRHRRAYIWAWIIIRGKL